MCAGLLRVCWGRALGEAAPGLAAAGGLGESGGNDVVAARSQLLKRELC